MDIDKWRLRHGRAWSQLSVREVLTLARWRRANGRAWKSELLKAWGNHCYGTLQGDDTATLAGLRNRLGPAWLARLVWPPRT